MNPFRVRERTADGARIQPNPYPVSSVAMFAIPPLVNVVEYEVPFTKKF
jgi:hypothetical protein